MFEDYVAKRSKKPFPWIFDLFEFLIKTGENFLTDVFDIILI
jgi:hypothetical protein